MTIRIANGQGFWGDSIEVPLDFLLNEALDGGGMVSLRTDAQGRTLSAALLRMEIDMPEESDAKQP